MALRLKEHADLSPDIGWPRDGRRYAVLSNRAIVGTILFHKPPVQSAYWSWHVDAARDSGARGGTSDTKDKAMAAFAVAWRAWLAEAGLVEVEPASPEDSTP